MKILKGSWEKNWPLINIGGRGGGNCAPRPFVFVTEKLILGKNGVSMQKFQKVSEIHLVSKFGPIVMKIAVGNLSDADYNQTFQYPCTHSLILNKVESEIMSKYVQQSVRSGRCLIQKARLRSDMGSVKPARRRDSPHIYDDLA